MDLARTAAAEGVAFKAGRNRRIAVMLSETEFYALKARALREGRTISAAAARLIAAGIAGPRKMPRGSACDGREGEGEGQPGVPAGEERQRLAGAAPVLGGAAGTGPRGLEGAGGGA